MSLVCIHNVFCYRTGHFHWFRIGLPKRLNCMLLYGHVRNCKGFQIWDRICLCLKWIQLSLLGEVSSSLQGICFEGHFPMLQTLARQVWAVSSNLKDCLDSAEMGCNTSSIVFAKCSVVVALFDEFLSSPLTIFQNAVVLRVCCRHNLQYAARWIAEVEAIMQRSRCAWSRYQTYRGINHGGSGKSVNVHVFQISATGYV